MFILSRIFALDMSLRATGAGLVAIAPTFFLPARYARQRWSVPSMYHHYRASTVIPFHDAASQWVIAGGGRNMRWTPEEA